MKLMQTINKIPAGLMIVPLFIGILINTFCPQILQIGSFTTATFTKVGAASFMGVQLVAIGTMLKVKETPEVIKRGGVLLLAKFMAGGALGYLANFLFGPSGFFGLTALALIAGITSANGSMYTALMTTYGDKIDCSTVSVLTFKDGPFLTLLALGASGLINLPVEALLATIIPLLLGMLLGNLDDEFTKFFSPAVAIMIPFVGLTLGGSINLLDIARGGMPGILLGLLTVFIAGPFVVFCDRKFSKRSGYAGVAISTVAGNAIATPAIVGLIDPSWKPYVAVATTQIAAAVVFTAIVVPLLTSFWVKKFGSPQCPLENKNNHNTTLIVEE